jgi:hypothetical protein
MGVDPIAVASGLVSLAMLGLLIWLIVLMYKWYKNPRTSPAFIQMIYYYFSPRAYDKSIGMPLNVNDTTKWVSVVGSTLSNCASNCNTTAGCNVFVYTESGKNCTYAKENVLTESTRLFEFLDLTTYVAADSVHPQYLYVTNENVNYTSPASNIMSVPGSIFDCPIKCNETSNCVAFTSISSNNCTLVNSTTSNVASSNVTSYSLQLTSFSSATFES